MSLSPLNVEAANTPTPQSENHLLRRATALLAVLVIAALVAFCFFASSLCITIILAAFLAILLDPVVTRLERWRFPRPLSSALILIIGIAAVCLVSYASYGKATAFLDDIPEYAERIREAISPLNQKIQQVQESAGSLTPDTGKKKVTEVRIKEPPNWPDFLVRGFGSVWGSIIIGGVVPFLTFFMLNRKPQMQSRVVGLLGKRIDVPRFFDRISEMVHGFVFGNLIVGSLMVAISVAVFTGLGLQGGVALGFASGILNLIPFLGVLLAALLPIVAGLLQFDSAGPFIIILVTVLLLHLVSANILIPRFIGSRVKIGPVAATVGILFWGWLWGAIGLLLAIPLTATIKIAADCDPSMIHISNFLAETPRAIPDWAQYGGNALDRAIPFLRRRFFQRARN